MDPKNQPPDVDVTRCQKHGLHYNPKLTRGCVICKREERNTARQFAGAKPGGGARFGASSFVGVAGVAIAVSVGVSAAWRDSPTPSPVAFNMKAPPRWKEVDPRDALAAARNATGLSPTEQETMRRLVREMHGKKVVKLFANFSRPPASTDGWVETINVIELPKAPFVDASFLAEARRELPKLQAKVLPGVQYRIVESSLIDLVDAPAVRLIAEATIMGRALKYVQLLVPGGDRTYFVTGTSRADDFEQFEPLFDNAMKTIRGAKQGVKTGFDLGRAAQVGAISAGAAGLVALIVGLVKRRRNEET
ncbi:MAG: hypothetical protein HYY84_08530 [Deltaproteobacteria bacterium]|nr:hypothetical protein [Deltaproteobacteria bacterium]